MRAFFSEPARPAIPDAAAAVSSEHDVAPATEADGTPNGAVVADTTAGADDNVALVSADAHSASTMAADPVTSTGAGEDDTESDDQGASAASDPTGGALFDYSSYTGGAPSLLSIATTASSNSSTSAVTDAAHSASASVVVTASSLFGQELDAVSRELLSASTADATSTSDSSKAATASAPTDGDERRIGRPSHPAWEHFARGEKRNRFHHNAYCRYCAAHGIDPEPIRGVSENMIRHLQKCIYCPEDIVAQLKMLCAQKDAARFSKRHQAHPSDVDMLLHDASSSSKRIKRSAADDLAVSASAHSLLGDTSASASAAASGDSRAANDATNAAQAVDDEFMRLHLPLLSSEITSAATQIALASLNASSQLFGAKHTRVTSSAQYQSRTRSRDGASKRTAAKDATSAPRSAPGRLHNDADATAAADAIELNRLVLRATLSAGLPWDWLSMEETARVFRDAHAHVTSSPSASALASVAAAAHAKAFAKMRDESVGVTLAIHAWTSSCDKTTSVLFSLVNALGEASVWELVDLGLRSATSDVLADKIKRVLLALHDARVQVINIVADTTSSYAAARVAVSSMESSSHDIPVLPCFSHVLSLLLGVVLTVSDVFVATMGDVIEIVQMFSNARVLSVLRRECGDLEASLVLPSTRNWYTFIECIDSVRQYEDVIKIIASKVLAATPSSASTSSATGTVTAAPATGPTASTRKDSAGNSVDELADARLSPSVLRAISDPAFWETVVSLSELVSPIKETHKLMATSSAQFSVSDVFYQFGRMHQQYGVILSDWEENSASSSGRRALEHVRFVQDTVETMWKLYDQPLLCLSYILNYNLVDPHLSLSHPSLQWLAIGKYAKEYFRRWFCAAPPVRGPRLALSEDTAARFLEDVLAYKERKYPFDAESVCEFENPRTFYLLVSDSNPLMHLFGARLFSLATSTPSLADAVPGHSFVSSATTSVATRDVLLPMLQLQLSAQTAVRPSKDLLAFVQSTKVKANSSASRDAAAPSTSSSSPRLQHATLSTSSKDALRTLDTGLDARTGATVFNKKQWTRLARDWRAHWERETDIDDLLRNLALLDPGLFRFAPNFSLDQVFKDKLPSRLPHDREEAVVDV